MRSDEDMLQFYRQRRAKLDPSDGNRWYLLIKELRVVNKCGLDEAHRIALAEPAWRRWLQQQINSNPQCRKSAVRHIQDKGDGALIEKVGDQLMVR